MTRRRHEPDMKAWIGSGVVHVLAIGLLVASSIFRPEPLEFEVIQMTFVSPPAEEPPAEEELVVETPTPPEPEPEPEPDPVPVEEPEPEPEPEPDSIPPDPEPDSTPPDPIPVVEPAAEPVEDAGEDIVVRTEGLRRDYPEYYRNILAQIRRCFRADQVQGTGWRATFDFVIRADGTVSEESLEPVRESGSIAFDLTAMQAILCGSRNFGPLPDELPYEELPVRFNFDPSGRGLEAGPPQRHDPNDDPSETP